MAQIKFFLKNNDVYSETFGPFYSLVTWPRAMSDNEEANSFFRILA